MSLPLSVLVTLVLVGGGPPPGDVASAAESVALVSTRNGSGSAFVVDEDTMVTAAHVVGRSSMIEAQFGDGATVECAVLVAEPDADLALLACDLSGRRALSLAAQEPVIGAAVTAIGYPGGRGPVATAGILGAVEVGPDDWIQTDAALNEGNSGGPLVDDTGQVVGVATAVDTSQASAGFAVPARAIADLLEGAESVEGRVPEGADEDEATGSGSGSDWSQRLGALAALLAAFAGGWGTHALRTRRWHRPPKVRLKLPKSGPEPDVTLVGAPQPVDDDEADDSEEREEWPVST